MSSLITNNFITQWSAEAKAAYEQRQSLLRNAVRVVNNVTGDTFKFHKLGSATAVDSKPRHADLVASNIDSDVATATLTSAHAADYIDDLDLAMTNMDVRAGYTDAIMGAINRKFDERIITAMSATSVSVTSGNTMVKARLVELKKKLDLNKVPKPDRFLLLSPGAVEDILNDATLTTRDQVAETYANTGKIPSLYGFNIIEIEDVDLLPVETAGKHTCYAFHKSAVGLAVARDVKFEIERVPTKDAWQVMAKMLSGAALIDTAGVVKVQIDD